MAAVAGALFAYYRSFVSVEAFSLFLTIQYVAMIIIGGMGSLLGALLGAVFVTLFPYVIEAALLAAAECAGLCRRAVRGELRRVRPGDDPVPGLRAARPGRHLAPHPDLFPALAVQAPAGRGGAQMSEPLLAVEKLEVVYQRAITAVQGMSLCGASRARSSPSSAPTAPAKPRRLRAISGFLGIDDARVTEGTIASRASASRTARRTKSPGSASCWCPSAKRSFPNLTVAENLAAPLRAAR